MSELYCDEHSIGYVEFSTYCNHMLKLHGHRRRCCGSRVPTLHRQGCKAPELTTVPASMFPVPSAEIEPDAVRDARIEEHRASIKYLLEHQRGLRRATANPVRWHTEQIERLMGLERSEPGFYPTQQEIQDAASIENEHTRCSTHASNIHFQIHYNAGRQRSMQRSHQGTGSSS